MAICEQGYLCDVCGEDVADLCDSDLYLRYVLGEVAPESLHLTPERHIRCNPILAQFIMARGFEPVPAEGFFAKSELDPEFVAEEEARVTRGYLRGWSVSGWSRACRSSSRLGPRSSHGGRRRPPPPAAAVARGA